MIRIFTLLLTLALLAGCRIIIDTSESGMVQSASGAHDCPVSSRCILDVSRTNFEETFTALPEYGYIFTGWARIDRGFCGNSLDVCKLSTRGFDEFAGLLSLLLSDETFYLAPRFGLASEHYSVERVVDGDTLIVRDQAGEVVRVRLYGIDAPESDQPYGDKAAVALTRLAGKGWVRVVGESRDQYDRLIARVYGVDGTDINLSLIQRGYAWWYAYFAPGEYDFERAENRARDSRSGLWADDNPINPYEWRNGFR